MKDVEKVVQRQPQEDGFPPPLLLRAGGRVEGCGQVVALCDHLNHVVDGELLHHDPAVLLELVDHGALGLLSLAQPAAAPPARGFQNANKQKIKKQKIFI